MVAALPLADLGFLLSVQREESPALAPGMGTATARAASRGDKNAFSRLVDLHKRSVYGLCLRLLRDPEEARDAAQETFARSYGSLAEYDPAQPFGPWALRIARNHCLDLLRRRLPHGSQVAIDAPPRDGQDPRELPDARIPPTDEALAHAELASSVEAAVAALPPSYREVVVLFHVEHLSYKEIAQVMGVPVGTVMTWLFRARARLRVTLTQEQTSP